MTSLADLRKDYARHALDETHAQKDALAQFNNWLQEALKSEALEATAMVLCTANSVGQPAGRVVLLKGVDSGFLFFTNYHSRKGNDIAENPKAALTFFWPELERQVRVEGVLEKLTEKESDAYFQSRPLGSQLGAWTSPQSRQIESREVLEQKLKELEKKFEGKEILPRPEHWGGYRLLPAKVEFWQGRPSRLHDRLLYTREAEEWRISRLAP
jgi:pyridoxamine 5'-phosphate oxidase